MLNLVVAHVAHASATRYVMDCDLVHVLVNGADAMARNGFPMLVHVQVQASALEVLTVLANSDEQGEDFALVKQIAKEHAMPYATKLYKILHAKFLSLEKFILDFLISMGHDADQIEPLVELGAVLLAADSMERQPLRAMRVMALLSMTRSGAMAIMG